MKIHICIRNISKVTSVSCRMSMFNSGFCASSLSVRGPAQVSPPLAGVGLEHDRCLLACPFPHDALQLDQKDRSVQPPKTKQLNK